MPREGSASSFGYFWLIRANHQQDALTGCSLRLAEHRAAPLGSHPSRGGDAGIEPAAACALVRRMVVAMMADAQALRPGVPFLVFRKSTPRKWVLYALKRPRTCPPEPSAC